MAMPGALFTGKCSNKLKKNGSHCSHGPSQCLFGTDNAMPTMLRKVANKTWEQASSYTTSTVEVRNSTRNRQHRHRLVYVRFPVPCATPRFNSTRGQQAIDIHFENAAFHTKLPIMK